jgi:hypothetical protein
MPNSATILSTLTLIIAFNYQHLITKAEDFEDCSKYLNTSPTTTNGCKFQLKLYFHFLSLKKS